MTLYIVVNGNKLPAMTLTLIGCPILNSFELFPYTIICSSFKLSDPFVELSCTQIQTDRELDKQTDEHKYYIVVIDNRS